MGGNLSGEKVEINSSDKMTCSAQLDGGFARVVEWRIRSSADMDEI
jgi:hypothetical protein